MNKVHEFSTRIAILLFAQSDKLESAIKPIATNKRQNDLLWSKMNQKVLGTIHKTNLPYFISDETTQIGTTFGEKLSTAVQAVFDQGFENIIIVGNDTPGLTAQLIHDTDFSLGQNDLVLGPDYNGGAYLIGLSKGVFNKKMFANLSWKTSKVFQQLKAFSEDQVVILKPLSDFNTISDFNTVSIGLSYLSTIKGLLLSLLFYHLFLNRFIDTVYTYNILGFNFNKGSPVLG
jgi:glycosyltransferase A (GT-A) superfamily protein (DUF2064 family)